MISINREPINVFFSTRTRTCYLKCNGNPLYDNDGKFVNYIFIFEDITETVKSEEVLRQSRRKTELAMKAANIMFWEFDAVPKLFYSDNEPLNGYDQSKPVSMALYLETLHPDDRSQVTEVMERMSNGEDFFLFLLIAGLCYRIAQPGNFVR